MNKRQQKILFQIFERPTRTDIRYDDLKSLLGTIGARFREGRGSRVRFEYDPFSVHFHKPHPQQVLPKYAVELIRDFLVKTGVNP